MQHFRRGRVSPPYSAMSVDTVSKLCCTAGVLVHNAGIFRVHNAVTLYVSDLVMVRLLIDRLQGSLFSCHGTTFDVHVHVSDRVNTVEIKGAEPAQGNFLVDVETVGEFDPGNSVSHASPNGWIDDTWMFIQLLTER